MQYDVIIIGAGPAGASAALEFSMSNLRVLVVEKESLLRDKPCGGAMPASVEKLLGIDLSGVIKNRTNIVQFFHNYQDDVQNKTVGGNAPLLVNRIEFDKFLLDEALRKSSGNIEVLEGHKVEFIDETDEKVTVILDNGEEIETRYIVGADGALGKTASSIGLMKKKKFAPTLDAEIITDMEYYNNHKNVLLINYFCLPHGYGWIFPKEKNRFSCGVGTWGRPINLKRELDTFIDKSFPKKSIEKIEVKGYPIPIYKGTQQIATKRVLLTGDAAALVDPVSGEGIRYAIHSGKIAAEVIIKALQDKDYMVSDEYQKLINEKIGKELKYTLSFMSLAFHHNPDMFYRTFVKRKYQ